MKRVGASAPGKMLISGEYAVLMDSPAVVSAVQRRAVVSWTDDAEDPRVARGLEDENPRYPESHAARRAAEDALGIRIEGELIVDVSALRSEDVKLGVGSSAAAAAAASAAVFASAGKNLEDPSTRGAILECALMGHADVAPKGSGVDVAASVLGGTLRYRRSPLEVAPLAWPEGLKPVIVWTGKAASTRVFLEKIAAFKDEDPIAHDAVFQELHLRSRHFAEVFAAGDVGSILDATQKLIDTLGSLGDASGADIIEARLDRISALAREHGGAAKPSGAGGGDVAIAFFNAANRHAISSFAEAVGDAGFDVLDEAIGGPGVKALSDESAVSVISFDEE